MTKLDDLTFKLDRTLGSYKGLSEDSQGRVVGLKGRLCSQRKAVLVDVCSLPA